MSFYLLTSEKEEAVFLWKYRVRTFAPKTDDIFIWKYYAEDIKFNDEKEK